MAMYNSHIGLHQDDSDITIINASIIPEHNDEYVDNTYVPIITRLKQANNSSENRQTTNSQSKNNNSKSPDSDSYVFVESNLLENAQHLEQILTFYIRDLKHESNTQLDCDKQLVTRLMDLIRPAYLNNQKKMIQLDKIMEEIGLLHDKRHIEQKEKIQQYQTEICRLNKMLFTASNDDSLYNIDTKSYSMFSTIHQGNSMHDHDQWTEIEDDAKKLHELVESQKNQINEIVTLISQTATAQTSLIQPIIRTDEFEEPITDKQPTPISDITSVNSLLRRIEEITRTKHEPVPTVLKEEPVPTVLKEEPVPTVLKEEPVPTVLKEEPVPTVLKEEPVPIVSQQEPMTIVSREETILENRSPETSPSQSFPTLISETLTIIIDEPKPKPEIEKSKTEIKEQPVERRDEEEQPHPLIYIPVPPPAPPIESKKCPVCNHEFAATSDDVEMYDHIEKCLFPTGINTEPKDYECPNCNRKFPGINETAYLEHLTDCFNRDI